MASISELEIEAKKLVSEIDAEDHENHDFEVWIDADDKIVEQGTPVDGDNEIIYDEMQTYFSVYGVEYYERKIL